MRYLDSTNQLRKKILQKITKATEHERVADAICLANRLHANQQRLGTPYIDHSLRVAYQLLLWKVTDVDLVIAAILHDTVEDEAQRYCSLFLGKTHTSLEQAQSLLLRDIEAQFGHHVAHIVCGLTNPNQSTDSEYYQHIVKIVNDTDILLVKVSDFLDNTSTLPAIADQEYKQSLITRYQPLVPVFVDKVTQLAQQSTPIQTDKILTLLNRTSKNILA